MVHTGAGKDTPEAETLPLDKVVNVIGLEKDINGTLWANIGSGWVLKKDLTVNSFAKVTAKALYVWNNRNKESVVGALNQGKDDLVIIDIQLALDGTPMGQIGAHQWIELSGISAI